MLQETRKLRIDMLLRFKANLENLVVAFYYDKANLENVVSESHCVKTDRCIY